MDSTSFSSAGSPIDTSVIEGYERTLLSSIRKMISDGVSLLKREKAYNDCQKCMDAIMGDQLPLKANALSTGVTNKLKKIALETASALTDVRPIWNYETYRNEYKKQGVILNKLARAWWRNIKADRKMVSALLYACAGGSGYLALTWDPDMGGGGDLNLIPLDPRDVIPIDPVYSDTLQDWRGVAVRQKVPLASVLAKYPSKAGKLQVTRTSWFGPDPSKGSRVYDVVTSVFSVVTGKTKEGGNRDAIDGVDLIRVWIKDDTIHTGSDPKLMDDRRGNTYMVYPVGSIHPETGMPVSREDAKLYPRGRLIILTPDVILEDIPNPYWHGMFPLLRITLDPTPWTLLGSSMIGDLMPLQNGLNEALRGAEDGVQQWIKRGVVADKTSLSPQNLKAIDTRKAGLQALLNPSAGEGFKIIDGPALPPWYLEMLEFYKTEMEENSGVRGLQQLSQLKQMPAADTVEKFIDALSPLLQLRARSVELALSELAEMLKVCFFQYYQAPRRFQILGQDGLALEDFDYDPNTLIPASLPGGDQVTRASLHMKNFTFQISQDSFLNISHAMQKMLIMQLFRANAIDPWSLWSSMNLADTGPIPAETIPERMAEARRIGLLPGPPPEVVQAQTTLMLLQAQMAMGQAALGAMGPQPGGPMGGGGITPPPSTSGVGDEGGRPPSGQEYPQIVNKTGPEGPRQVVSESGR